MPGYVIHLATAEEYLRKHESSITNHDEFIDGVIFPDSEKDKSLTHYGRASSEVNLYKFLNSVPTGNNFNKGYFLHLLTDYLFYNKYIDCFSSEMYHDYDVLNKPLIKKYKISLPDKLKNNKFFSTTSTDSLKILSLDTVDNLIDEVSSYNLEDLEIEIKNNPQKWTKIRPLKIIPTHRKNEHSFIFN